MKPTSLGRSFMIRPKNPIDPKRAAAAVCAVVMLALSGCNFLPDVRHKPQYHNPFPQLQTVAVLPFRNQSQDSTVSGSRVTAAYYSELQSIPGFEVIPVGVVEAQLIGFEDQVLGRPMSRPEDFQRFAKYIGVDAVLQGSITDFTSYYPPRMTLKVNWYAANEGFHPIPPGYGLPWGTKAEKKIDESIRLESERALAREQLKSQSPLVGVDHGSQRVAQAGQAASKNKLDAASSPTSESRGSSVVTVADLQILPPTPDLESDADPAGEPLPLEIVEAEKLGSHSIVEESNEALSAMPIVQPLPEAWPDPQGFVPASPKPTRPIASAQSFPIISHMKAYNGSDEDFTERLSDYYYFRDDGRFGGWEAYLQRSEDFIRFCCHLHVVETLAARGGQLESRTVVRWPIDRYER